MILSEVPQLTSGVDLLSPLLNFGSIGGVLAWFLFKADPRLKRIEQAMDRNTKGQMLFLTGLEDLLREIRAGHANAGLSPAIKREAVKILEEVEVRQRSEKEQ